MFPAPPSQALNPVVDAEAVFVSLPSVFSALRGPPMTDGKLLVADVAKVGHREAASLLLVLGVVVRFLRTALNCNLRLCRPPCASLRVRSRCGSAWLESSAARPKGSSATPSLATCVPTACSEVAAWGHSECATRVSSGCKGGLPRNTEAPKTSPAPCFA